MIVVAQEEPVYDEEIAEKRQETRIKSNKQHLQ